MYDQKTREYKINWAKNNPDKVKAIVARFKAKHQNDPEYKERLRQYRKKYNADPVHKAAKKAYMKEWRAKNKERLSAYNKKWIENNKEWCSQYQKEWRLKRKNNPYNMHRVEKVSFMNKVISIFKKIA